MQKSEMLSGERRNTRSLDLCVPILSLPFGKINGSRKLIHWGGSLATSLIIVRGRKLVLRANAIWFSL